MTPQAFAKNLIKREGEYYMPLKNRTFENNWGGKAGARQAWVASLKENGHTFDAVREGLLTLENAFFELTGGFSAAEVKKEDEDEVFKMKTEDDGDEFKVKKEDEVKSEALPETNGSADGAKLSGKGLLYDNESRYDIELESQAVQAVGNDVNGLWNNSDAREIFQEIIRTSKTVSVLALGLDLICRNADAYINKTASSAPAPAAADNNAAVVYGRRRAAVASYADFF